MSIEYEVKIQVEDLRDVEEKLRKLGAVFEDEVFESDFYIDLRPYKDLKASDEALRVRISYSSRLSRYVSELTYKGPKLTPNMKVRKEITVGVDDGKKLLQIFKELGFSYYVIKKKRRIYRYGPYKIFLDEVPNLGRFIEIEVEGVSSVEQFVNLMKRFIGLLKLSEEFISKSYLELFMERLKLMQSDIEAKALEEPAPEGSRSGG